MSLLPKNCFGKAQGKHAVAFATLERWRRSLPPPSFSAAKRRPMLAQGGASLRTEPWEAMARIIPRRGKSMADIDMGHFEIGGKLLSPCICGPLGSRLSVRIDQMLELRWKHIPRLQVGCFERRWKVARVR